MKEPYNMFQGAGSPMAAGNQHDDMMVLLKGLVEFYGTGPNHVLRLPKELCMYIDRSESLYIDDVFNPRTGEVEYHLSIVRDNPVDPVIDAPEEEPTALEEIGYKIGRGCGVLIGLLCLFIVMYLFFHIISAIVAGVTS